MSDTSRELSDFRYAWEMARNEDREHQPTLRDQFAMAALSGLAVVDNPTHADTTARNAYKIADAMLKEREK